ncbi:antibiotic biosynthesis monooxygenase [Streptomyces sp. NPDC102462]|uniref:antibiotic biosynthesis monooxygenase n=1 Tax=Streptomyces sp. NPDC102462 TaxID=3366178 RepID=UPI0037FF319F
MEFTLLTLRPAPGRRDELVAHYRAAGILEASGALSSQVLVPEGGAEVVVTALWADDQARADWQNSPRRKEFARGMAPFFDSADAASTRVFHVGHHSDTT